MICPNCKAEYREGFSECADCHISLVVELPRAMSTSNEESVVEKPVRKNISLVKVFSGSDPVVLTLAKSILEKEEIRFVLRGEGTQSLFGIGTIGTGFNVITGPAEIFVDQSDVDQALKLLKELEE